MLSIQVAPKWHLRLRITLFCTLNGVTYMDAMTGDLPFLFQIFKRDLKMKA